MIYYGGNDYRDYLAHYGVLGMKWGIRRYQPYSVKPRGSGKTGKEIGEAKKYGKVFSWAHPEKIGKKSTDKSSLNTAINSYLDKSSVINQYLSKASSVKKQLDGMESMFDKKPRRITAQNQDPISDAGLKAFFKTQGYYDIGWEDSYDKETPETKADLQEWFSYEDQTIGFWEISNLVKKGKTANDIHNIINTYNEKQDYLYSELDKVKEGIADHIKSNPNFNQFTSNEINYAVSTEVEKRVSAYDYHEHLWSLSEAKRADGNFIDKYISSLQEEYGRTSNKDTKKSSTTQSLPYGDQEALTKKLNSLADKDHRDPDVRKAMREAMNAGYDIEINNSGKGDKYKLVKVPEEDRAVLDWGSKSQYGGLFDKFKNGSKKDSGSSDASNLMKSNNDLLNSIMSRDMDDLKSFSNAENDRKKLSDMAKQAYKYGGSTRIPQLSGANAIRNRTRAIQIRANAMKNSGYTRAEIAKRLGIPVGSLSYYLNS